MPYLYLTIAIVAEVIATSFLKQSDGFSKLTPSIITVSGYAISFFFLSLSLRDIPTGIAYAIWSGVGIVLIASIAWIFHGQKLDTPAMVGMGFIITGVAIMNLLSKTTAH